MALVSSILHAETVTVTYDTQEQILINPESIPVIIPDIKPVTIEVPTVSITTVPEVDKINTRMEHLVKVSSFMLKQFQDQRNLQYDEMANADNETFQKWLQIYNDYADYSISFVKPIVYVKMIAEARVPENEEEQTTLTTNLDYYKKKGYNAILMPFYLTEDPIKLEETADLILQKGYKLFISYSGPEDLHVSVFKDPESIKSFIEILAPKATGYLLGWRRTALHLFIQDKPFVNYIAKCARDANPNIQIYGEGYLGQTGNSMYSIRAVTYNLPTNISGCIIGGVGYSNYNIRGVMTGIFEPISRNMAKIAIVVGDKPYYGTTNNNHLSFEENLAIKQDLERKFLRNGCIGTITLHGDGGNGELNDNMSQTKIP